MTKQEVENWHEANKFGARDEAYMDVLLAALKVQWLRDPQQRLGQLVFNFSRGKAPIFFLKDEAFLPDE